MATPYSAKIANDRIVTVTGRSLLAAVLVDIGSYASFDIVVHPSLLSGTASVLDDLAVNFQYFRFVELKVTLQPPANGSVVFDGLIGCVWTPSSVYSAPPTLQDVAEAGTGCFGLPNTTIPSTFKLTRKHLMGEKMAEWFNCDVVGEEEVDYQGMFHFFNSSQQANTLYAILEYRVEFRGFADMGLTPRSVSSGPFASIADLEESQRKRVREMAERKRSFRKRPSVSEEYIKVPQPSNTKPGPSRGLR